MPPVLGLSLSNLIRRTFAFFMVVCVLLLSFMEYRPSGTWGVGAKFDVIMMAVLGLKILARSVIILGWNVIWFMCPRVFVPVGCDI